MTPPFSRPRQHGLLLALLLLSCTPEPERSGSVTIALDDPARECRTPEMPAECSDDDFLDDPSKISFEWSTDDPGCAVTPHSGIIVCDPTDQDCAAVCAEYDPSAEAGLTDQERNRRSWARADAREIYRCPSWCLFGFELGSVERDHIACECAP